MCFPLQLMAFRANVSAMDGWNYMECAPRALENSSGYAHHRGFADQIWTHAIYLEKKMVKNIANEGHSERGCVAFGKSLKSCSVDVWFVSKLHLKMCMSVAIRTNFCVERLCRQCWRIIQCRGGCGSRHIVSTLTRRETQGATRPWKRNIVYSYSNVRLEM